MTLPDIDTIQTYGGPVVNYLPVEDPTVDQSADAAMQAFESVAQGTHTVMRAWCRITLGAAPTVTTSDAGWGNTVPPTVANSGTGFFTITWPATVTDGLNATHTLNFRYAFATVEGSTFALAQANVGAPNKVTVNTAKFSGGPVADNLTGVIIFVGVG